MTWVLVVSLAIGAFGFKALGVLVLGSRPDPRLTTLVAILPAALFAAIVALETFQRDESVVIDARSAGLAVAVVAAWRRLPFVVVVVAAMVATASARALG